MWPRISIENSMQIHSVLVILVIAIFCPIAIAARLTVDASGDLRFGSNTVTLKGDLSVQGVSVLDSFTSLDTTLVQSDLYNLYRLNALRIQKFDYNLSSSAVFATNGETYMVATSLTASTFYLFKWNNASLNFDSPSTTPFPGAPGACIGNSVKVLQTNSSETYVLFACNGAVPVYTYKFISGSLSSSQASFSADAPRSQYGLSVGASDASAIQHSSGTIFYTQMTAAGSANNIYRTVGTAQPVWSGNNTNAATASHFFTIGTTLYAAIGYSNVNYTQIVYTTDGLNFTNHHTIPSYLVADIDTFVSGNTTYMLVTESVPESKLIANQTGLVSVSEVYKWNGTGFSRLTGDVIVQNPHNSKIFTFQDNIFLVVSNSYASSADYAAQLFRWNKVVEEFTLICSITNVSNNYWWEGFSVGGKSYLVLNTAAKTFVYKLNLN